MTRALSVRPVRAASGLRFAFGVAVSLAFLVLTLARVDLGSVAETLRRTQPAGVIAALLLVSLEVVIRAWRWQYLLKPVAKLPFSSAFSYLCIGYFANSLLPARLGDVARAYLTGTAFGIGRLATLGTILVERLADGVSILLIVVVLGLVVGGVSTIEETALALTLIGIVSLVGLAVGYVILRRSRFAETLVDGPLGAFLRKLASGAVAVRSPEGLSVVVVSTLLAFAVAAAALLVVAGALSVPLSPLQGALVMGAVALSTALPAAPGSLGTYEFVGTTVLVALGVPSGPAFATVLLVHVMATLPPAIVGLAMTWILHLGPGRLAAVSLDAERAVPE